MWSAPGDLPHIDAGSWTLRLRHFLIGDMHGLISFIDGFAGEAPENRYILSNELGDGRVLIAAPRLTKHADGYSLLCPVAPGCTARRCAEDREQPGHAPGNE